MLQPLGCDNDSNIMTMSVLTAPVISKNKKLKVSTSLKLNLETKPIYKDIKEYYID